MDYAKKALQAHEKWQGKIEVRSRVFLKDKEDLSIAYTPGVAAPCLEIEKDVSKSYDYTRRGNLVAVVTDGTAVLGLGDIGPEAAMPVMEGKCALFKAFADVDAFPLCVRSKDVEEIVQTISLLAGSFGGINLEDIAAPRCFEIEKRLQECCDIPIFHDDQHGTAVVALAALINALKLQGRKPQEVSLVINGAGAAGIAIAKLLLPLNFADLILCGRDGVICAGDPFLRPSHAEIAALTNKTRQTGSLSDALKGRDVFIGVSSPNVVTGDMVKAMNPGALLFPMANPVPEIMPDEAKAAGAYIVGTGRSDFPNQINNVLAFPGIFRGALDVRASLINKEMLLGAAYAIADCIEEKDLRPDYIIPSAFNKDVAVKVAKAVAKAAKETGVARI